MSKNARETRIKVTVPITIELTGTTEDETEEILERAKRVLELKIQDGEDDYEPDDIDSTENRPQYTMAEIEAMNKAWEDFLRGLNNVER